MNSREEFELLVEKRLAGTVSADEQARLKAMIASDAELRAEFLIAVSQEAALKAIHQKPASASAELAATQDTEVRPSPGRMKRAVNGTKPGAKRRGSNPWFAPLAACAVLALGVLLYFSFTPARAPVALLKPSGPLAILRDGKEIPATGDTQLFANDEIRCSKTNGAGIDYSDATRIILAQDAIAVIAPPGQSTGGKCIQLKLGKLSASVSKQPTDRPMLIRTAQAEATVLGTQFEVDTDGTSTKLSVQDGKVRFASVREGKALDVSGGEFAIAGGGSAFAVSSSAPPPHASARNINGLVALYTFQDGSGSTVKDTSDSGTPLNLTIADPSAARWLKDGGLEVTGVTDIVAHSAAKILNACRTSGALSVELWITPARIDPETLRFVLTLHGGPGVHLLEIAQNGTDHPNWQLKLETSNVHHHGEPAFREGPQAPASSALTHVVFTRDAKGLAKVYINGEERAQADMPGDFSQWDGQHDLSLAGDGSSRVWSGTFHRVAFYARALSAADVKQNYAAGR